MSDELKNLQSFLADDFDKTIEVTQEVFLSDPEEISEILGSDVEATLGDPYLVFKSENTLYAFAAESVAEVGKPLPFTPLLNCSKWLLGIANWRSDIISVIDLSRFWTNKPTTSPKSRMLILRGKEQYSAIALVVDGLREITTLQSENIEDVSREKLLENPHIQGQTTYNGENLFILSAESFLGSLTLESAA